MRLLRMVPWDLSALALLTLLASLAAIFSSGSFAAITFGVFLVLVIPGLALLAAVVPENVLGDSGRLDPLQRLALAVVLSVLTSGGVGAAVASSPGGFTRTRFLAALCSVLFALLLIAALRRRHTTTHEVKHLSSVSTLSVCALMLAAVVAAAHTEQLAEQDGGFSELSLLSADGFAAVFPSSVRAGTSLDVLVVVANHQGAATSYTLTIVERPLGDSLNETVLSEARLELENDESREIGARFHFPAAGEREAIVRLQPDVGQPLFTALRLVVN